MDNNPSLDVLRDRFLVHCAVCHGAIDNIGNNGDQEFAAGILITDLNILLKKTAFFWDIKT
jgi:mono/diheme cytochrome c family protein